jgi:hypothetical protein
MRSSTRRLLIVLSALAAVFVIAVLLLGEIVLRPVIERQIAEGLAREFELADPPAVSLGGFPILADLAAQRARDVDIRIEGETFSGLRVERIDVRLERVSFAAREIMRGSGDVRVTGGAGTAVITATDLTAYLRRQGLPINVEIGDGVVAVRGRIDLFGRSAEATVGGSLEIVANELRFAPLTFDLGPLAGLAGATAAAAQQLGFTAPLPDLEGIHLTDLRLTEGRIAIRASVDEIRVAY